MGEARLRGSARPAAAGGRSGSQAGENGEAREEVSSPGKGGKRGAWAARLPGPTRAAGRPGGGWGRSCELPTRGLGPPRRPACPGQPMQPTPSDLHRGSFVLPGGRSARCDFCSFGPEGGLEVSPTLEVGALFPILLAPPPLLALSGLLRAAGPGASVCC